MRSLVMKSDLGGTTLIVHADDAGDVVAQVYPGGDLRCAYAQCFAAAPELLAALKALLDEIHDHVDIEDGASGPRPNWAMRLMQSHGAAAQAAIAKAEDKP